MNRRRFLSVAAGAGAALFIPSERLAFGVPRRALWTPPLADVNPYIIRWECPCGPDSLQGTAIDRLLSNEATVLYEMNAARHRYLREAIARSHKELAFAVVLPSGVTLEDAPTWSAYEPT